MTVAAVIFAFDFPPVGDYLNHVVRLWLLSGGVDQARVARFYAIDWRLASTNIGLDLCQVVLGRVAPSMVAARILLLASFVMPPIGGALLNRVLFGRSHWWQMAFTTLTWTTTALFGFMSYQVAIGVALFGASMEPFWVRRPRVGFLARLGVAGGLLVFHLWGVVFYAFLVAGLSIGPAGLGPFNRRRIVPLLLILAARLAPIAAPMLGFLLWAPTLPGQHHPGPFVLHGPSLPNAFIGLASPLLSYDYLADALFAAPLLAISLFAVRSGGLRAHGGLLITGLGLALVSMVMPVTVGDAGWVNRRLPLMAALTLMASVQPRGALTGRWPIALCAGLAGLFLARSAWIRQAWTHSAADVRGVEQVLAGMPRGSALLTVQVDAADWRRAPTGRYLPGTRFRSPEPTLRHVGALAVILRQAFVPTLFSTPGQQPLRVLPPWDRLATSQSMIPDAHEIEASPSSEAVRYDPYLLRWSASFDYVLVTGLDETGVHGPFEAPANLDLVARNRFAALYRILKPDRLASRGS